jgi:hypothetical protein
MPLGLLSASGTPIFSIEFVGYAESDLKNANGFFKEYNLKGGDC